VDFDIENTIPFTLASGKNKILGYKSKKICTRSLWGKIQTDEQNQRITK